MKRFRIWDYQPLTSGTCSCLLEALKTGPLTAAIVVAAEAQSYKDGVLTRVFLTKGQSSGLSSVDGAVAGQNDQLNHAVTVVGYDPINLFKIKNSWGSTWGEKGYAYLA